MRRLVAIGLALVAIVVLPSAGWLAYHLSRIPSQDQLRALFDSSRSELDCLRDRVSPLARIELSVSQGSALIEQCRAAKIVESVRVDQGKLFVIVASFRTPYGGGLDTGFVFSEGSTPESSGSRRLVPLKDGWYAFESK